MAIKFHRPSTSLPTSIIKLDGPPMGLLSFSAFFPSNGPSLIVCLPFTLLPPNPYSQSPPLTLLPPRRRCDRPYFRGNQASFLRCPRRHLCRVGRIGNSRLGLQHRFRPLLRRYHDPPWTRRIRRWYDSLPERWKDGILDLVEHGVLHRFRMRRCQS